jgi:hypothetical protein
VVRVALRVPLAVQTLEVLAEAEETLDPGTFR